MQDLEQGTSRHLEITYKRVAGSEELRDHRQRALETECPWKHVRHHVWLHSTSSQTARSRESLEMGAQLWLYEQSGKTLCTSALNSDLPHVSCVLGTADPTAKLVPVLKEHLA